MRIRLADNGAAAAVNELLHELGNPQDGVATTAARIRAWSADPAGAVYVADADGDLFGLVAVHSCPFFERAGSWGRIVALVVSARARGRGIGGQLVAAAESFATSRGCVDQAGSSSRFLRELNDTGPAPRRGQG